MKHRAAIYFLIFLIACSSTQYRYTPADKNAQSHLKAQVAQYAIPSDHPEGQLQILSQGVVDFKPMGNPSHSIRALQLRMTLSTDISSSAAITFNSQLQTVSFPNQEKAKLFYAILQDENLATIEVGPGEIRTFDLYFKLPSDFKSEDELPAFNFNWQLQVGKEKVSKTTQFDRVPVPTYTVVTPYALHPYGGFSPGWSSFGLWYGP